MDKAKLTIPYLLHHWTTHQPDKAAFIFRDSDRKRRLLTRADVYRLASRFAAILRRHDVGLGDLVCNTLPNSPERLVSDLGVILAGAVAMNGQVSLAYGDNFIRSLQDSSCAAVILDPMELKGAKHVLSSLEQEAREEGKVHFPKLPALRLIYECRWEGQEGHVSFMDMLERESDSFVADVTADDLAYVWTSSGSTGFSKLIPHTHERIITYTRKSFACFGFPFSETVATNEDSPLTRAERANDAYNKGKDGDHRDPDTNTQTSSCQPRTGKSSEESNTTATKYARFVFYNDSMLGRGDGFPGPYLWFGSTRVMLDMSRGCPEDLVAAAWTLAREEGCQLTYMQHSQIHQLLSRTDLWQSSGFKFKVGCISGQPVHKTLVKEAIGSIFDSINVSYGAADFGELTTNFNVNPDLFKDGNNGKPLPGVEVKVVDENLQEIPPGGQVFGEILVRADTVLKYYLNNEEATRKTMLSDGWCRTGDVGYLDEEGDLFVLCRISFGIKRGSSIVYPGWIEGCIKTHPAVCEVLVVPVPDPVLGQELCACVTLNPEAEVTAEELREFCENLFLASRDDHMTSVPRYFLFFSHLPTTPNGKLCRQSSAAEAKARLFGDA